MSVLYDTTSAQRALSCERCKRGLDEIDALWRNDDGFGDLMCDRCHGLREAEESRWRP